MRSFIIRYIWAILVIIAICFQTTSCLNVDKKQITYTYEELNKDLISVDVVFITISSDDGDGQKVEWKKTLSEQEVEYVTNEISSIEFERDYFVLEARFARGINLILHYTEYDLTFDNGFIHKLILYGEKDASYKYHIHYNEKLNGLLDEFLQNETVNSDRI